MVPGGHKASTKALTICLDPYSEEEITMGAGTAHHAAGRRILQKGTSSLQAQISEPEVKEEKMGCGCFIC